MPRIKKRAKVKEPIRLRMKELADGSKSLYLDIYRNGKRSYEYLKMYIIPETDDNARKRNAATMTAANTIKSRRIIELTNGEAGIKRADNQETVSLLDWMNTYMENQQKRGKKDGHQIKVAIQILKDYAGERVTIYRLPSDGISSARKTRLEIHGTELLPGAERSIERCCPCRRDQTESLYENWQFGQDTPSRKQKGVYDYRGASGIDRHPDEERGGKTGLSVLLLLRTADKRYNRLEMGQRLCG